MQQRRLLKKKPRQPLRYRRRGALLTELLVAIGLLSSILAVAGPMSIRLMRVRKLHQQRLIAIEELTNQLERLTQLPIDELTKLPPTLDAPDFLVEQLNDVQVTLSVSPDTTSDTASGQCVTVAMVWTDAIGVRTAPLLMTTWVYFTRVDKS